MTWQLFCLEYQLRSPLHIGYHKVGNVQRTRYYIPARNLWASATERLAHSGFRAENVPQGDYQKIGVWLRDHCAFTYFFIKSSDGLLCPKYTEDGLQYGNRSATAFERHFLAAHVTTAIESTNRSAKEESLHEVEYIRPHDGNGARTCIAGWIFFDEIAVNEFGGEWHSWFRELRVGGERRYGFGHISLKSGPERTELMNGYVVRKDTLRPEVQVSENEPFLAHTMTDRVKAMGLIEPLVGRETKSDSTRFGRFLTPGKVCWTPGSIAQVSQCFSISREWVWEPVVK